MLLLCWFVTDTYSLLCNGRFCHPGFTDGQTEVQNAEMGLSLCHRELWLLCIFQVQIQCLSQLSQSSARVTEGRYNNYKTLLGKQIYQYHHLLDCVVFQDLLSVFSESESYLCLWLNFFSPYQVLIFVARLQLSKNCLFLGGNWVQWHRSDHSMEVSLT